jgi:hypothetical protein
MYSEAMQEILAELKHTDFQIDGTYEVLMRVLSRRDWRFFAFWGVKHTEDLEDELARMAQLQGMQEKKRFRLHQTAEQKHSDDDPDTDDENNTAEKVDLTEGPRIINPQLERTNRLHGAAISTAQLVISDEYELVHLVCPINGLTRFCIIVTKFCE